MVTMVNYMFMYYFTTVKKKAPFKKINRLKRLRQIVIKVSKFLLSVSAPIT